MKKKNLFLAILIIALPFCSLAQTKLNINDVYIGLADSSFKNYIQKLFKGEIFHIRDKRLTFLYDKPVNDSIIKFIVLNNEDSIKNYFSEQDFKYNREKAVIEFDIVSIFPDTVFINVKNLIMTAGHFNKTRRELIGYTGQIKLYALYDRKLNKWVVDRLNKCIRCPDQ